MANQKILDHKQVVIDEIAENVKNAATTVWFDNNGLSVAEQTELRRTLRENGCELKVYKNTLTQRALDSLSINLNEGLEGPKVVAFGTDTIAPIKTVSEFAKKHPALEIKVGIVDGKVADIELLNKLASVPSRDVLLTMLAGGLMGTVRDLSIALHLYSEDLEK
ncbi:MAG: 50S ribosomal protein L10 [Bacilli bacterium]|nr:50S ribosomal protein L10 [Bacilli bacterium]